MNPAANISRFPELLRQRNELLREAFDRLDGPPWTRFTILADISADLYPLWRAQQYSNPPGLDDVRSLVWQSAKLLGKLPPATAHGIRAALLPLLHC